MILLQFQLLKMQLAKEQFGVDKVKFKITKSDNTNDKFGEIHRIDFENRGSAYISNQGLSLKTKDGNEITSNWEEFEVIIKQAKEWLISNKNPTHQLS